MKTCTKCKENKPLEEYQRDSQKRDGLRSNCKTCCKLDKAKRKSEIDKYNKNYHIKNKKQRLQYAKQYRTENIAKVKESSKKSKQKHKDRVYASNALYRAQRIQAVPQWLTEDEHKWIQWLYKQAQKLEEVTGIPHHVDHIVPLKHPKVCGLHTPYNLQILTAEENTRKGNKWEEEDKDV